MKYVVYREENGMETPLLFPDYVPHASFKGLEPISAGFWDGEIAFGESVSLGINSRQRDTGLIKLFTRRES